MPLPFIQKVDLGARRMMPFGITLILMLFAMTPTYIAGLSHITPMYALMAVYFWSIYRPDLLGYGTVFAIGLLEDLLAGTPIGSTSLILLVCQRVVFSQQKFFNSWPFALIWVAFALLAGGAALIRWVCVGLAGTSGFTPFGTMVAAYAMTIAIYPIVAWFMAKAQMKLLAQQ